MHHNAGWFAFYGLPFVAASARCVMGLCERPRNWENVLRGGGLVTLSGFLLTATAAEWASGYAMPMWALGIPIVGVLMYSASMLLRDQRTLRDCPAAWGSPARVAGLPRIVWVVSTYAMAATTAAFLAIPGNDLARFSLLPALGAPIAGFAWLRAHLRQRPPGWLMRLGGRSERTPDAPQSSAA